ncbi:MAG TPA: AarF/UbiB family protein, partial [Spirochaetota bacterium]|nr:AarF/UbiB family protein [Spirochaetota bacterium]
MFNNLLQKQFTHLNRYREIIQILIKYNFISLIRHLKLDKHLSYREKLKLKKIKKKNKYGYWERYRLILQDLGPTFVKLGQILSNRHDVLPPELITEFTKLQQDVQPLPFTNIKNTIETELQKPLHKIFRHIDKKPLASASIAQVHKAALLNGRRVAVKIQRPDIKDRINTDLEITLNFAVLLEKYIPRTRNFRPVQIVKELKERIFEEINFINELNNMQRFKNNFEDNTDVYVPAVYKKYSTRKIVTMEFISGIK